MKDQRLQRSLARVERLRPWHITVVTAAAVVALFLMGFPILDAIELRTYDLRFLSRGPLSPDSPVVVAAIDEKSLDAHGRWPWSRQKMAFLVNTLSEQGARVIGFDIGFFEPERTGGTGTSSGEDQEPATPADQALAGAIRDSKATVVLGYFFHMADADVVHPLDPSVVRRRLRSLSRSKYPFTRTVGGADLPPPPYIDAYAPETNIQLLSEATPLSGYFNMTPDPDGVSRKVPLVIRCGDDLHPPLSVQCVRAYLKDPSLSIQVSEAGIDGIELGGRFIPTDENGNILINYLGPARTFRHVSVADVMAGHVTGGTLDGRIVLVGPTAAGIYDFETTPFGPGYPGLEVHATLVDNLLTGRVFSKPTWTGVIDLTNIVLVCVITGLLLTRLSAAQGLLFLVGFFAVDVAVTRWVFIHHNVWLNVVYPLAGIVGTGTNITFFKYFTEERKRKEIRQVFGQYVSGHVIDSMLKDPDKLKLGGEEKELSVLFCDLAGFTDYSEKMEPSEMVEIISDFFKLMTDEVFEHQGTLKEYVGDELMAIFGAPLHFGDHAVRACQASVAMQDRLRILRQEWPKQGRPPLRARVGINTGRMLVGNLGSVYRFSYGVLGDQVNLASRLEGLNKLYGTEIIIGQNTADQVGESFRLRLLDWVRVKGRQAPERVYELLGPVGTVLEDAHEESIALYASALPLYMGGQWVEAREAFEGAAVAWPSCTASRVLRDRCRYFMTNPCVGEWDGAFRERRK